MSCQTVEVELENGRVRPVGSETLPARAHALLTILSVSDLESAATPPKTLGEALRHLSGIGRGEYIKLSTNKAHMDDFGR